MEVQRSHHEKCIWLILSMKFAHEEREKQEGHSLARDRISLNFLYYLFSCNSAYLMQDTGKQKEVFRKKTMLGSSLSVPKGQIMTACVLTFWQMIIQETLKEKSTQPWLNGKVIKLQHTCFLNGIYLKHSFLSPFLPPSISSPFHPITPPFIYFCNFLPADLLQYKMYLK